jgi:hypothetical protein
MLAHEIDILWAPTIHILRDVVIITQKNNEGMTHIKRWMQERDWKVAYFHEDAEGTLWFKERFVVPTKEALKKRILDEVHTTRYSIHLGKLRLLDMCQNVTPLGRSRSTIWSLEDCYKHWASQIGSEMTLPWTSLWVSRLLHNEVWYHGYLV